MLLVWRALGRLADPVELVLDRLLATVLLALLLTQPLGLGLEETRVIGIVGIITAAIELEHPGHDIVEEVAIVGDEDDVAGIIDQMAFEPRDAFGVEMVGRLVEQQDVGLFEQQLGQRDAATLAARERVDRTVAGRAAQCFHRDLELVVERPAVDRVDLLLKHAHLFEELVEIGVVGGLAHLGGDRVEPVDEIGDRPHAVLDVLHHRLVGIEMRLLREIADGDAFGRPSLAAIFGVHPAHDLHQRRLAGAVDADDRDLGAGQKLQADVVEHGLGGAGKGLGQALHDITILDGHGVARLPEGSIGSEVGAYLAMGRGFAKTGTP